MRPEHATHGQRESTTVSGIAIVWTATYALRTYQYDGGRRLTQRKVGTLAFAFGRRRLRRGGSAAMP